jgi:hypothetical protein
MANGVSLHQAMAAARSVYGEQYNPILTMKSLTYFGDGDLSKLTSEQKARLVDAASTEEFSLPEVHRNSRRLSE